MRTPAYTLAFAVSGLALAVAAPVRAQSGYNQQDAGAGGYGGAPGRQGYGQDRGGYDQDRGASSASGERDGDAGQGGPDLGRELSLRSDQRAALQAYQQATTPSAAEQQRMQDDMGRIARMTTPQRLDFTSQQMEREQSDFGRRAQAVRRFYAQLTPTQQRRFDQVTAPQQGEEGEGGPGGYGQGGYDRDGRSAPPR